MENNTINTDNISKKGNDIFLILSKLFYATFLVYYGWFQMVFFTIPNMSLLLGSAMVLFILFHSLTHKMPILKGITIELLIWGFFIVTSLATGIIVAANVGLLLSSLFTFLQYLIMIFGMTYISSKEKKIDFLINIYVIFAIICSLTTIFSGYRYSSTRITMSEATNPNTLGMIMVIGLFCILFKLDFKRITRTVFHIIIMFMFIYIMF